VFGVTTTVPGRAFDPSDLAFAQELADTFALDALAWGDPDYGAPDSRLRRRGVGQPPAGRDGGVR
jgi:hypothetical protein